MYSRLNPKEYDKKLILLKNADYLRLPLEISDLKAILKNQI
jgi:hypothetical protein